MDLSVEAAPKLRVGDWLLAIIIAFIVSMSLGILAGNLLHVRLGDVIFLLGWPGLTYGILKYKRVAAAKHIQRMKEVGETVLRKVLAHLPAELANPMKQPLQRLCADILWYEGAFQNRRLPPRKIEEILYWLLYYWFLDRSRQLQISNLLTRGESGEATFPVPLYRLHTDVANSIENIYYAIRQHSSPDDWLAYDYPFYKYPFKRLALKLYYNWANENGFNPELGEAPPKKGKGIQPSHLKDKISVEELIRRFLQGTPFVDFLLTKMDVSNQTGPNK